MDIVKSFRRGMIENKNLIFISIILSCLLRLGFILLSADYVPQYAGGGYLWDGVASILLSEKIVSAIVSLLFTIGLAFYLNQLNARYALIRTRTYIVPVVTMLIFSLHPAFVSMTPQYIGGLSVAMSGYILLSTYQDVKSSGKAYSIGFVLAVGSLFSFYTLMYLPLFILGLRMMRCLTFKSFVAIILGVLSIYWLAFFAFLAQGDLDGFAAPFRSLYPILNLSFNWSDLDELYYLVPAILLSLLLFFNYQANSFHDKIQIRANMLFFYVCFGFSLLSYIFILYDSGLNLYITVMSGALLLSHFLSLAHEKWKVMLFYLLVLLCVAIYIYNL
ncbi:hypothetical protein [Dysgonomonas macrotermitis]|uniref:Beta-carotene 15,15'-monooxygenase n=1 Tax=Dysgonomonas macrotermitis TaxID=1346286 RepID=A0A1M5DAD2_9BACT|nr:hypothetical protein [Dysgonomonas macrotermitis]SHF63943.1 hypothetical protein SAMN05444362_108128 [Dysgonomonas macrotermitis]